MTRFVTLCEHDPVNNLLQRFRQAENKPLSGKDKQLLSKFPGYPAPPGPPDDYWQVTKIVLNGLETIFEQPDDKISLTMNLLFSVLEHAVPRNLDQAAERISKTLLSDPTEKPELKINLLTTLTNMLRDSSLQRPRLILAIFEIAKESKRSELLKAQLARLPNWIKTWKEAGSLRSEEDVRQIYFAAYKVAKQAGDSVHAQTFLMKYLGSFETVKSGKVNKENLVSSAADAVIQAVTLPVQGETHVQSVMDLRRLKAVSELKKTDKYSKLYRLLEIYHAENVKEFNEYCKKNGGYLEKLGIEREPLLAKMRMLTLCTLKEPRVSFGKLKEILEIQDEEGGMEWSDVVEQTVIDAVQSGLIEAKIDQENTLVEFQRRSRRTFTNDTWKELAVKLRKWRSNTVTILEMLHNVRVTQGQAAQAAMGQGI